VNEDSHLHTHRHENIKSYNSWTAEYTVMKFDICEI
jgi:hypothetical protein